MRKWKLGDHRLWRTLPLLAILLSSQTGAATAYLCTTQDVAVMAWQGTEAYQSATYTGASQFSLKQNSDGEYQVFDAGMTITRWPVCELGNASHLRFQCTNPESPLFTFTLFDSMKFQATLLDGLMDFPEWITAILAGSCEAESETHR